MTIEEFLEEVKKRIKANNLDFVPTRKNRRSRQAYGLSILDIEDTLLKLTPNNLYKGPQIDRDLPEEELWIFKSKIGNTPKVIFYIKLKLRKKNKMELVCISFHD